MHHVNKYFLAAVLVTAALYNINAFAVTPSATPKLSTIWAFKGAQDGLNPQSNLVFDKQGALYGTTLNGGGTGFGAVFQLTPSGKSWAETVIYRFGGGNDGANPYASLVFGSDGNLYGTTAAGGSSDDGTVFELAPPASAGDAWTETVIHTFTGADGQAPNGVIFGSDGALYGTTGYSGASGFGNVFKLAPPAQAGGTWTATVLYSFAGGTDGANPFAGVAFDSAGNLYGTTYHGGSAALGTVYQLAPAAGGSWTESVIYSFAGGRSGSHPIAGVSVGSAGLFGTTYGGGTHGKATGFGTVYELAPPITSGAPWKHILLYSFAGGKDGRAPYSGVTIGAGDVLYGTTHGGGGATTCPSGCGTIFKVTPPKTGNTWSESVLHSFRGGTQGSHPLTGVTLGTAREVFGATFNGGSAHQGTVFELTQ